MQEEYDVLVVGAGPAGSSAAFSAAKNDAKVLLIDKKKIVGKPVQCAEYIPKLLLNQLDVSNNCIAQKIKGMKTYTENDECFITHSPGYILHRDIFDKELVKKATDAGSTLLLHTTCVSKHNNKILIHENGEKKFITSKIIIGADGPRSTVGSFIHSENASFIIGVQHSVPLISDKNYTRVYVNSRFYGGYAWMFPKKETANVGFGIKQGTSLVNTNKLLDDFTRFLEKENIVKNNPILKTSGLIPVGGFVPSVKDNILLVGDAAGQTHPITGGGIPQAVICGRIAGETASTAIKENDLSILTEYETQWKNIFSDELQRAKKRRELLENNWDDLDTIFKKCWITFREYYE
ncbi:MAG: NAD(P)/FAD-dependent oxidoreductase [Candidatus Thermoplasmatota archaeon]|nr:NAD(P)/FAD-dependent oxidoreductase [Candidatus Thermoplasmatota archaeon]